MHIPAFVKVVYSELSRMLPEHRLALGKSGEIVLTVDAQIFDTNIGLLSNHVIELLTALFPDRAQAIPLTIRTPDDRLEKKLLIPATKTAG